MVSGKKSVLRAVLAAGLGGALLPLFPLPPQAAETREKSDPAKETFSVEFPERKAVLRISRPLSRTEKELRQALDSTLRRVERHIRAPHAYPVHCLDSTGALFFSASVSEPAPLFFHPGAFPKEPPPGSPPENLPPPDGPPGVILPSSPPFQVDPRPVSRFPVRPAVIFFRRAGVPPAVAPALIAAPAPVPAPKPLRAPASSFRASPFYVLADTHGDENHRLFEAGWRGSGFAADSFFYRPLGPEQGRIGGLLIGDRTGRLLFLHTAPGDSAPTLNLLLENRKTRSLGRFSAGTVLLDWSPDERFLLLLRAVSASSSDLLLYEWKGGADSGGFPELSSAGVLRGEPSFADAFFDRSATRDSFPPFFVLSDRGGQTQRLFRVRWPEGEGKRRPGKRPVYHPVTPKIRSEVEWAATSPDGAYLVYALNRAGRSEVYVRRPGKPPRKVEGLPPGVVNPPVFCPPGSPPSAEAPGAGSSLPGSPPSADAPGAGSAPPGSPPSPPLPSLTPSGSTFFFSFHGARTPGDLYAVHTQGRSDSLFARRLALPWETPGGEADPKHPSREKKPAPPEPRLLAFPGFSAWLHLPASAHPPFPVVVKVHGGPELQARPEYDSFTRHLVEDLGYAVVEPNVRGSTGFGRDFQKADDGLRRIHALRDLDLLLDSLAVFRGMKGRPLFDSARMAVLGRSYGGFMALSAALRKPGRVRAAVSTAGIVHFPTFLETTSAYRRDLRRVEYGDERDPAVRAFLDSLSPLNRLAGLKAPLLLCQGSKDPRVPAAQARTLFDSLAARRVPAWHLEFEEEGHAIRGEKNRALHEAVMSVFLRTHLH